MVIKSSLKSNNAITILIGGDLGPTITNYSHFSNNEMNELIDERLMSLLTTADLRIFNLEVPLTDSRQSIDKDGPSLFAPATTINGIQALSPSLFTLANNHIMDMGWDGLNDTIKLLNSRQISYVGAGENLKTASKANYLNINGLKVGVYACAENEFSIAGPDKPGANPFDPLESPDHISTLKENSDYVIVLHHGGREYYRYPTPELQKVCRKMVDRGADLIVCQHSHSVGSYEEYEGGTIVYGQGNFLFDRHNNKFWNTGLMINATLSDTMKISFIPITKRGNGVCMADHEVAKQILDEFNIRTEQIKSPGFIKAEFDKFCMKNGQYYLATLAGFGKTLRRADKLLNRPFTRLLYSRKKLNTVLNHFECEAHRELVINYLKLLSRY